MKKNQLKLMYAYKEKIESCINSCQTFQQWNTTWDLIDNFHHKFGNYDMWQTLHSKHDKYLEDNPNIIK